MADLIIKPATGASNSLLIKDQAGGAVITTGTSGATIASATLTSPILNTGISGTAILDEDAMGSDSDTKLATQQSIKAYADTKAPIADANATHTGDVAGATALTIQAGAVDIAMLSATGTAGATTFLRGDNSWVVPTDTDTTDLASDSSPQLGGSLDVLAQVITTTTTNGHVAFDKGITEKVGTGSASGTTITVDLSTGNFFEADISGASGNIVTFTISNPDATANQVNNFVLKVKSHASYVITWATVVSNGANIDWAGGSGPDITVGSSKYDILAFTSYDNGTTWYGTIVGQDFS
jgi:hypothetical protein